MARKRGSQDSARLLTAFSQTSAIALSVYDNQLRFRAVNLAAAATPGIPAEAFVGNTLRDMIGDAAPGPEARLRRLLVAAETPAIEVSAMLPTRADFGYWIEKNFAIKGRAGRVNQIVSLAVEVTAHRKLEQSFHKLGGELPRTTNDEYRRLARELHDSVDCYHAALAMSLEDLSRRCRDPERFPELLAQSMEALDERMLKLLLSISRCFPT